MHFKKALVFGLARSGAAAARLLRLRGAEVTLVDAKTKEAFGGALDDLNVEGVHWHLGESPENLLEGMEAMILSPGIPDTHPAVLKARRCWENWSTPIGNPPARSWPLPAPTAKPRPRRCWAKSLKMPEDAPGWWGISVLPMPRQCRKCARET